jgi:hypothetical protein
VAPIPAADTPPLLVSDSSSSLGLPLAEPHPPHLTPVSPSPPRGGGDGGGGEPRIAGDELEDGDGSEPEMFKMEMDG